MQNKNTIHWTIACDTHPVPRTGTVRPFAGESWPHMARFLVESAGDDWFLVAYSVDENGDEVEHYEIGEDTDITVENDPALWFRDPYAQKHHPLNNYILIVGGVSCATYVQAYAWPGGYPVFYFDREDNCVCPSCVGEDILSATDTDPHNRNTITGHGINHEDTHLYCDECGARIEAAYVTLTSEHDAA